MMKIFGTGHRPEHCDLNQVEMVDLAESSLSEFAVDTIICGMAAGWDLALGQAAMSLDLKVWSVRPWAGHRPRVADEHAYNEIERYAERHVITNDSLSYPGPWAYQVRNEWMVDNGDLGLALWNGKKSGGTWNCIKYADRVGKPVENVWPS